MFEYRPVPKKLDHKRSDKPTQKQLGAISQKVRKQVRARSQGVCERCKSSRGEQMAHVIRRTQLKEKTTSELLLHLCIQCHIFADNTKEGREWLAEIERRRAV